VKKRGITFSNPAVVDVADSVKTLAALETPEHQGRVWGMSSSLGWGKGFGEEFARMYRKKRNNRSSRLQPKTPLLSKRSSEKSARGRWLSASRGLSAKHTRTIRGWTAQKTANPQEHLPIVVPGSPKWLELLSKYLGGWYESLGDALPQNFWPLTP
jgi:hypothetical protein